MLKAFVVLAVVSLALANPNPEQPEQSQVQQPDQRNANTEQQQAVSAETTEQRNNNQQQPQQTFIIVKPSKSKPHKIICRPNEMISECVTPCQPTCEFPNQLPCPEFNARSNLPQQQTSTLLIIKPSHKPHHEPPPPCSPGCVCGHGFVRSEFGVCIPKSLCPPLCKPHSHFEKCGPRCQPTCELAEPRSLSVCGYDKGICVSGCFCDSGYVKDLKTGHCVKPKDCTQICPENEHYSDYGVPCAPTCQNPVVDTYKCSNYSVELPGCYCNQGFLRDWSTKKCVRDYECPYKKCPHNEQHYKCKPCTPTCNDPHKKCSYPTCVEGCDCKKGLVRDEKSHKCVPLCECHQFQAYHAKYQ